MKVYTLVDNAEQTLVTTDRLKALESLYKLVRKYEEKQSWFWITEEELQ